MVDKERLKTADMRITWRAVMGESEVYAGVTQSMSRQ